MNPISIMYTYIYTYIYIYIYIYIHIHIHVYLLYILSIYYVLRILYLQLSGFRQLQRF